MFYTIYKITNTINDRYYIGMHKTQELDDGYMGSGKLIRKAIQKYGISSFRKEILFVFDNEDDMRNKERELVVLDEMSYNLCDGGKGGFGYINRSNIPKMLGKTHTESTKKKISSKMKNNKNCVGNVLTDEHKRKIGNSVSKSLSGTSKSEEHKRKISEAIKQKHRERKNAIVV